MEKFVGVVGGNKYQREIVQRVANWCIHELLPNHRKVEVVITLKNLVSDGVEGWCMEQDDRLYDIEVEKNLNIRDLITVVAHELVHVKQYVKKEMVDYYDKKAQARKIRWKKTAYGYGTAYERQPWEKEAFRLQEVLAEKMWKEGVI
jgi:hypothetical protein|tara:strand:+ start:966 stop:1406 length:441 start_codon:yes stop_codon:yes gene_type:complete